VNDWSGVVFVIIAPRRCRCLRRLFRYEMEVIADGKHGLAGGRHGNGLEEFIETECVGDLKTARGMLVWNPTVCSEAQKAKASFLRKQWGTRCLERENKNREIGRATRPYPLRSKGWDRWCPDLNRFLFA
jgi:hypothetical protein